MAYLFHLTDIARTVVRQNCYYVRSRGYGYLSRPDDDALWGWKGTEGDLNPDHRVVGLLRNRPNQYRAGREIAQRSALRSREREQPGFPVSTGFAYFSIPGYAIGYADNAEHSG